jgi:hypothetical protein
MDMTNSRNLRGDALTEHAAKLGIEIEDFRGADGAIRELDLRQRVSMVERYSSEFHIGKLLAVCLAAFGVCGVATWLAIHFLWHPYW